MECICQEISAFVLPHPSLRHQKRGLPLCQPPPHRQHHIFRKTPLRSRLRALTSLNISLPSLITGAVQASPVSNDSDGELQEHQHSAQKSYSIGVTIISGCDASSRRKVIEEIAAESRTGRLVVVTSGGITETEEQDVQPSSAPKFEEADMDVSHPKERKSADSFIEEEANYLNGRETQSDLLCKEEVKGFKSSANLEGWISCSSVEEMAEVIAKVAASRECDYIIAEGPTDTSMEPQDLARLFHNRGGASLRVDTLVSVLDSDTLLRDLAAVPTSEENENNAKVRGSSARPIAPSSNSSPRSIEDLVDTSPMALVSLIENANVIILNEGSNEPNSDTSSRVQELVALLNSNAKIVSISQLSPVDQLLDTNAYDRENVFFGATWKRVLVASRNAANGIPGTMLPKSLKEGTFVYCARRPFHPTRLYQQIKAVATFTGVIRSTGRIWLATRMLAPLEWNQAGVSATLRVGKLFWAAVPQADWPTDEVNRESITRNWDTQYGDRETEIVFVGKGIDKPRLQGLLDGCLLQDEEMVFNNLWANFEDPFVEWVPLIEEEYDDSHLGDNSRLESEAASQGSPEPGKESILPVSTPNGSEDNQNDKKTFNDDALRVSKKNSSEISNTSISQSHDENLPSEMKASTEQGLLDLLPISELEGDCADTDKLHGGEVESSEMSEEVQQKISALDVLERGFSGVDSMLQPLPKDQGYYDEDDSIIASWDGDVANGILTQMPKIGLPVTIVTGFLGSGKTTLLNYILTANHGLRIAVLVNEFGEIDIDNQLVEKGDWSASDEVLELANGCICCSINDSFVNAVSKIIERSDEVDYLIVETTGVADPVPVINSLMVSDIADDVRVDGILTLVDAENFDQSAKESETALSQIMAADTILLSKTDLVSAERMQETINYIKSVRPAARILKSQRGRVPVNMILDVGIRVADSPAHANCFKPKSTLSEEQSDNDAELAQATTSEAIDSEHHHNHSTEKDHDHDDHSHTHKSGHSHEHNHDCEPNCTDDSHDHSHNNHLETDGFVTTSFKSEKSLILEKFMSDFLQRLPEGVFRAKGLLSFYGYEKRYIFQLSGRRYEFEEGEWPEDVAPGNQIVIIGRDLDLEMLKGTLEKCLVSE